MWWQGLITSALLVFISVPPLLGEVYVLVDRGQPRASIVVPDEPNVGEQHAASELQTYIKKISGAELPILTERGQPKGFRILLGRACGKLDGDMPEGDGFVIRTAGDALLIKGNNERGTLYGVYDMLEELGVRWFMPGEIGEVVPKRDTIAIEDLSQKETPSFAIRWVGRMGDWPARMKCNVAVSDIGITIFGSAHTFRVFLSPVEYFDEHPEWFALVSGERRMWPRLSHRNQICTSNQNAVAEVVKNMRRHLDEHPETEIITLFPNDGLGFCECEPCKALDEPEWPPVEEINRRFGELRLEGRGTLSRRLMIFNNQVAKALSETHPHVKVKVGAYSCYTAPPRDKSLSNFGNIIVQICHSWCHNHAVEDERCEINRAFREAIERWAEITPSGVMLYEYYYKAAARSLPWPILHSMKRDIPYFKRIGVIGLYTQYAKNWGTLALQYYIPARLLWNVEEDVDGLVNDFCEKFYGPAAEPMKKYYERLEKAAIDSDLHMAVPTFHLPEIFTDAAISDCGKHLAQAEQRADSDLVRERLQMVRISFTYLDMAMDYVKTIRRIAEEPVASRWIFTVEDELQEARAKADAMKEFISRPEAKNIIGAQSNYIKSFLNPAYVFGHRAMPIVRGRIALTKQEWLEGKKDYAAAPLPKRFDLWICGHDFDANEQGPEHQIFVVDEVGKRRLVGPLPPSGEACNRKLGCVVYRDLAWPCETPTVLKLVVVHLPTDWTASTVLAAYVLPGGMNIGSAQAAEIIANHPNWPRRNSMGFLEYGFKGVVNTEAEPTEMSIELVGPPEDISPLPQ